MYCKFSSLRVCFTIFGLFTQNICTLYRVEVKKHEQCSQVRQNEEDNSLDSLRLTNQAELTH